MPEFVTAKELSKLLNVTEHEINRISKKGIPFNRSSNGLFDSDLCSELFYDSPFVRSARRRDRKKLCLAKKYPEFKSKAHSVNPPGYSL
jgi:hypothetical protein